MPPIWFAIANFTILWLNRSICVFLPDVKDDDTIVIRVDVEVERFSVLVPGVHRGWRWRQNEVPLLILTGRYTDIYSAGVGTGYLSPSLARIR